MGVMSQFYRSMYEISDLNWWHSVISRIWDHNEISCELVMINRQLQFYVVCDEYYQSIVEKQLTFTGDQAILPDTQSYRWIYGVIDQLSRFHYLKVPYAYFSQDPFGYYRFFIGNKMESPAIIPLMNDTISRWELTQMYAYCPTSSDYCAHMRHNNRANICYVDGHVEAVEMETFTVQVNRMLTDYGKNKWSAVRCVNQDGELIEFY